MEVIGFGGRGENTIGYILESGTNILFGPLPHGENISLIPRVIGKTVIA